NDHEQGKEFVGYVLGRAIWARHPFSRDHNRANQTCIDILGLEVMRVIEPRNGTAILWAWTCLLSHQPRIGMRLTGWDQAVGFGMFHAFRIHCALRVAVV